jgi:hypothetical protein
MRVSKCEDCSVGVATFGLPVDLARRWSGRQPYARGGSQLETLAARLADLDR